VALFIPIARLLLDERDIVVGRPVGSRCGTAARSGDQLGFVVDRRYRRRPRRAAPDVRYRRRTTNSVAEPRRAGSAADAFVFCAIRRDFRARQHLGA
jgi:hypothetical protein